MPPDAITIVRTTAGEHELPAADYARITTLIRQGARFIEVEKLDALPLFVRVEEIIELEAVHPAPAEAEERPKYPWEA